MTDKPFGMKLRLSSDPHPNPSQRERGFLSPLSGRGGLEQDTFRSPLPLGEDLGEGHRAIEKPQLYLGRSHAHKKRRCLHSAFCFY